MKACKILKADGDLGRCIIGEGPIWNERSGKLYYTNGFGKGFYTYTEASDEIVFRPLPMDVPAFAFDSENRLIISHKGGVHILNDDDSLTPIYDNEKYKIENANDMKVGPDGAIYVGTQCGRRVGVSDKVDGKLYRISPDGDVRVLLDGLILSNGMDWSIDGTKFYHTDSDNKIIKEYDFDLQTGNIRYTGRHIYLRGVDGFTIGLDNRLYVGCWGHGHIAVVDLDTMLVADYIGLPARVPTSCGFMGENMDTLAVTTASYNMDVSLDKNAGFTLLLKLGVSGREPYVFGEKG